VSKDLKEYGNEKEKDTVVSRGTLNIEGTIALRF
jgi:hypothetical protein